MLLKERNIPLRAIAKICSTLSISTVQIREKLLPKEDVAIQFVEVKETEDIYLIIRLLKMISLFSLCKIKLDTFD